MKNCLKLFGYFTILFVLASSDAFAFTGGGIGGDANTKDLQLQLDASFSLNKDLGLDILPFFSFRPIAKTVFEEESGAYFQYDEYRFNIGTVLSKSFFFTEKFGLFVEGGGGYSISKYSGVSVYDGNHHLFPVIRTGICFRGKLGLNVLFKIGYEYLPIENVPANRGYGSILFGVF
ncbi:MAG: hypothetical protein JXK07_01985 [Spirochaetes bacterium]|nr:hypothetical protein [Spirochaetota bacterium]MBN2769952.1 hypothetical protein [Spirochaetota bacterium]